MTDGIGGRVFINTSMIKLDWNKIVTELVQWVLIGIMFIGLHLITTQAIDGYTELKEEIAKQQDQIDQLQEEHDIVEEELENETRPFRVKLWRTISFYEFRK